LKSTNKCVAAYKKANRMLGLKRPVVSIGESILIALSKSLVRSHVEFCCSAFLPHIITESSTDGIVSEKIWLVLHLLTHSRENFKY